MNPRNDRHHNMYEDPLACLLPWWAMMQFFLMFPSNSVIVFLRSNLGYRLMKPWVFGVIFLFLWLAGIGGLAAFSFAGGSGNGGSSGGTLPLLCFALGLGGLAIFHRRRGWKMVFSKTNPLHTMSRGDSHLVKVLPMVPEWIIQRYVEPFLVMVLGLLMLRFQWTILGLWFMLSGLCLAAIEAFVLEAAINAMLDPLDDRIEANMLREMDAFITGNGQDGEKPKKIGGLVTASPELLQARRERLGTNQEPTMQRVTPPVGITN
jgi:hypothetical protein